MPAGSGSVGSHGRAFTDRQASELRELLQRVRRETGLLFSVHVGRSDGESRQHARRLHGALEPEADRAVLIFVDPAAHRLEIVTGVDARHRLDDRTCGLAAMSMSAAFGVGDLTGGIVSGVSMLADHARRPEVRHQYDDE